MATTNDVASDGAPGATGEVSLIDLMEPFAANLRWLVLAPLLAGVAALGISFLVTPTFTARTTFLPPQQQQSAAAAALGQLGALAGLAGSAAGIKSPADQYVALLLSVNVSDRIIDGFDLQAAYRKHLRVETREKLAKRVSISLGRKDGLIAVEVEDESPQRAADMANRYVDELRRVTSELALSEAQQRRRFFEAELKAASERLAQAQAVLQASGFTTGALKAEPKAAAEGYARLRAEATAAEVRLQTLRNRLADESPEVQQQLTQLSALRSQLARLERNQDLVSRDAPDYVSRYRDFKYQEALFELFARQYEMARLDESREGTLIQVVDPATPPERKSWPRRGLIAAAATLITALVVSGVIAGRHMIRRLRRDRSLVDRAA